MAKRLMAGLIGTGLVLGAATASNPASAEDCASRLDLLANALEQSDLEDGQAEPMRQELEEARKLAEKGDHLGCMAAATELHVAMLESDDIAHESLCGQHEGVEEVGEADMAGEQDVHAALQTRCADQRSEGDS